MSEVINNDKQLDLAADAVVAMEVAETRKESTDIISVVENTVADFLGKAIDATLASNRLVEELEQSLIDDVKEGKLDAKAKVTVLNIERSSRNDAITKLLNPSIGFLSARQQALIQSAAKQDQQAAVQVNVGMGNSRDATIAASAPPEAVSGLDTIFQLIASRKQTLKSANPEDVVDAEVTK